MLRAYKYWAKMIGHDRRPYTLHGGITASENRGEATAEVEHMIRRFLPGDFIDIVQPGFIRLEPTVFRAWPTTKRRSPASTGRR